jgi:hypothetical protein
MSRQHILAAADNEKPDISRAAVNSEAKQNLFLLFIFRRIPCGLIDVVIGASFWRIFIAPQEDCH